jgi:two-component system KDP operon response regulator KdpE
VPEALAVNTAISFTTNTNGQNYGGETTLSSFSQMAGALDAGADDYMVKPFGVEELLARVRLALRHRLQQRGLGPVFRLHGLGLDPMAHRVTVGAAEVKLSRREFELLRLLAEHAGKVMTHRQILTAVWGEAHRDDVEYLRVYVRQLRSKLGDDPASPRFIETEPGVGYRLKAE